MEKCFAGSRFVDVVGGGSFFPAGLPKLLSRRRKEQSGRLHGKSLCASTTEKVVCLTRLQKTITSRRCRLAASTDLFLRKNVGMMCANPSVTEMQTSGGLGELSATTNRISDEVTENEYSVRKVLVTLRNGRGPGDGRTVFPSSLSAKQRRRAHETAERLGLGHVSVGQGTQRHFTAWRMSVAERLSKFRKLLDVEEVASRASFSMDQPLQSWKILEAKGILLHKASVIERDATSFGRERWVLEDGIGVERVGHVSRFVQHARPGAAIRIAEKDTVGRWVVAEGQPPGRVAWIKGPTICLVFDYPPTSSDQVKEASVLRVPDSTSFDRMRSVITDCERAEKGMKILLEALLGSGICSISESNSLTNRDRSDIHLDHESTSAGTEQGLKVGQSEELLDKGLNIEQRVAVKLCTEVGKSPIILIHGPFGTGKTRTLVEVVRQQVKSGKRVLVCAASNAAVDNMALALLTADPTLPLARAGVTERVASSVAAYTMEALQDSQPEAAIARKLRREAYAMQSTAEKWTRAANGGERRRNARKEVNALFKDARRLDQVTVASVLRRTKILCGTLTGFATPLQELGNTEETHFDCVVIDEASQIITPALLLALPYFNYSMNSAKEDCLPLIVMAGDHQQLPPTVLSDDVDNKGGGLKTTIFEELTERDGGGLGTRLEELVEIWEPAKLSILGRAHAIAAGTEENVQESVKRFQVGHILAALRQQYRMPAQLMAFPSATFYGAELVAKHRVSEEDISMLETQRNAITILHPGLVLEVIDTAGSGFEEEKSGESLSTPSRSSMAVEVFSISNSGQANLTARIVQELLLSGTCSAMDVGVVTPYSAQVMLLRQIMVDEVKAGLEIDSVDAFQGREKDVVILDTVRSNTDGTVGFLGDFQRLNVAITRASHKLIVVGDSATLSTDRVWALFFQWVSECQEKPGTYIGYRSIFELPIEG